MKTTVFIVAIVALGMLGCQDTSSLNPVADRSPVASLDKPAPTSNIIVLKGVLRDPMPFNSYTEIAGEVSFKTSGQALCEVAINTSAMLKPWGQAEKEYIWKASGSACDRFKLLAGSSVTFEKVYLVAGRTDGTFLHLTFNASRDKEGIAQPVELVSMSLARHPVPIQPDLVKD